MQPSRPAFAPARWIVLFVASLTACGPAGGASQTAGGVVTSTPSQPATSTPVASALAWPSGSPPVARFAGRIAFVAFDGVGSGAYMVNGETGSVRRLTEGNVDPTGIAWSPDGSTLAVSRTICPPDPCGTVIALLDVGTGSLRDVTPLQAGIVDGDPAFSPDGRRLVFRSNRSAGGDAFTNGLFTVSIDGGALTSIPRSSKFTGAPRWSPDGAWIGYLEAHDFEPSRLIAVHPDGSGMRVIVEDSQLSEGFAWSPDGRLVAFRRSGPTEVGANGENVTFPVLWRVSDDGTDARPFFGSALHSGPPAWAADGRSIAFIGGVLTQPEQLWIAAVDGSTVGSVPLGDLVPDVFAWTATSGG